MTVHSSSRPWLNQSTHSRVANWTSSSLLDGPRWRMTWAQRLRRVFDLDISRFLS
jgi:hypothetical protein